jgi:hypothetical protein
MRELILYLYTIPILFKHILIRFIAVLLTALFNQQSCMC